MVKKKKESKTSPQKQKSRAKYDCPPELQRIIDLAASIPANQVLPDWKEVLVKHKETNKPENFANWHLKAKTRLKITVLWETYQECLQFLPKNLQIELVKLILKVINLDFPVVDEEEYEGQFKETVLFLQLVYVLRLYDNFRQVRAELQELVDFLIENRNKNSLISNNDELFVPRQMPKFTIRPTFDEQCESIKPLPFDLYAAIQKTNLNRLRACEICSCSRIFWAKREDSKTCSAQCLNTLNVRRHRALTDEEKAKRKAQREANRERNKKLKQLKEKKNGTV